APAYNQEDDCLTQFRKTMQYNGRQYCTSGNKDAKTPAKSLFAARFLEALRKRGDGKMLRFDDLEYWLGKIEMPQPETGTFAGHQPGGDFMFVRKNACTGTQPVNNPMDAAEEQTWKIAQNRQDGQIYLEEYPTGKHAREAENLPGNKGQHPASKPEAAPSVPAPFELTYKFNYDFVFDKYKYSPKIRPLGMKFPDKKIADHVKTSDYQYFEKQLKKRSNSPEKVSEMTFCLGYVLFVTKQFSLARQYFEKLINEKNSRFYEASNYYSGCIFFFENQTDASLECFEKLKGSLKYQKYAEKHRISVLYLQSKMNEVISSGTSIFDSIELGKRGDLPLLLGLAYLELKNYERADYYFELVRTDSLIDATLYADAELVLKVAANKIKLNKLDKAMIELLGGIYLKESSLAIQQATWYYRAQAYMANNDKVTARNCLAHSKAINYNPDAQEESALNYGKLSYELLYDQDAVTTLSTLIRHPIFGEEARYWLSQASKK
ncbi:MAG: hypothetical protein ABIQ93_05855, partial [Saprospiraceae bacterium]